MSKVRIGVVGLGAITQSVHLPLLARRWDLFEIVSLADLSASRVTQLADRYGVPGRFTSLGDLLAAHRNGRHELDGVLVATTGSHGPEVLEVVRSGLPVLCEKPLALSMDEIDRIDAVEGARLLIGYMKEHDPATVAARAALDGVRLRGVDIEVLHPSTPDQLVFAQLLPPAQDVGADVLEDSLARAAHAVDAAVGTGLDARWRRVYSDVVLGSIVHDISLLRHLVGGVDEVETAVRWADVDGDPGSIEVTGTVSGDARFRIAWHYLPRYPDYRETVTFHHEAGSVSLVFGLPYLLNAPTILTIVTRSGDGGEVRTEHRWNQQEAFENELAAFHAQVTLGARPSSSLAEGRADLEVAQRILRRLGEKHGFPVGGEASR